MKEKSEFLPKLRKTITGTLIGFTLTTGIGGCITSPEEAIPTNNPPISETTLNLDEYTKDPEANIFSKEYDILIYGNNISGIGVIRGLEKSCSDFKNLKIALIGTADYQQGAISNGLCIEDLYEGDRTASGFYKEIRDAVIEEYKKRGLSAKNNEGRLVYEPEVIQDILEYFVNRPNITYYSAHLKKFTDKHLLVDDNGINLRLGAKFFVDASVEADLARLMGASYRTGKSENIYNDYSEKPPKPSLENNFNSPQAISELLTLEIFDVQAPKIAEINLPFYDKTSYDPELFKKIDVSHFRESWSMKTAILPPGNKRELNEFWTDLFDPQASYDWYFGTAKDRERIRKIVINRAVNFVRYLQENGFPEIGISNVNPYPYIRGEIRIIGETTYTGKDVKLERKIDTIATGAYATFDRHSAIGECQHYGFSYVHVPMGSLIPVNINNLLVTSAISTDCLAYNSAVRMESVRANTGYAAGAIIAEAIEDESDIKNVIYEEVSETLEKIGSDLRLP